MTRRKKKSNRSEQIFFVMLALAFAGTWFWGGWAINRAMNESDQAKAAKKHLDIGGCYLGDPRTKDVLELPDGTYMVLPDSLPREYKITPRSSPRQEEHVSSEHERRVSDEDIAHRVAEIEAEDVRAKENGEAHGNYGEEYGVVVRDLRDCRAALAESQEREKVLLIENTNMSGLADEMDALQQQHDALRAAASQLVSACEGVDTNKSGTDAIACGFGPVLDEMENVIRILYPEREAASGEPTP